MEELNRIQKELKVNKSQFNEFGNYNYRSCEDILEAIKSLLGDCTLTLNDEIVQVGERIYVEATATLKNKEDSVEVSAYAREPETQKGMNEAQITGSASSYARKYALNGLFCIDDTKDADIMDNTKKETKKPTNITPHGEDTTQTYLDDAETKLNAITTLEDLEVLKTELREHTAKYFQKRKETKAIELLTTMIKATETRLKGENNG